MPIHRFTVARYTRFACFEACFVLGRIVRMISPEQERVTAKRMNAKTLTLPTSHVPMLSKPGAVADFIVDAASGTSTPTPPSNH
jgi:hypothetical protein